MTTADLAALLIVLYRARRVLQLLAALAEPDAFCECCHTADVLAAAVWAARRG